MRMPRIVLAAAAAALLWPRPSPALINPLLQPWHLAQMHGAVVLLDVTAKARDKADLAVRAVRCGQFAPRTVTVSCAEGRLAETFAWLAPKAAVIAFAGAKQPEAARGDVLLYAGGGSWAKARMADGDPARWTFLGNADEKTDATSSQLLFGTFNGSVENLDRLLADHARGADYFPAVPFTRLAAKPIGKVLSPGGAAVADLNGDGRLDLLACGRPVRLFVQTPDGAFEDRTEQAGLAGVAARSVSVDDADGDGRDDLLLDGTIRLADAAGRFGRPTDLPAGATKGLLSSAFVCVDGDARPDVVVSRRGAGLAVLLNTPGGFQDATKKLGLDAGDKGADLAGYFDAGDFDGDGRTDLFHAAGRGCVLYQNADGTFQSVPIQGEGDDLPAAGTAAFGYLTRIDAAGLFVVAGDVKCLLEQRQDGLADVTRHGNEIQDPAARLGVAVAEDLNADGTVDLYAAGTARDAAGFFATNRGYGSFMLEDKYAAGKAIPPAVLAAGATGLAVGDVTGDGANDVLVVGCDGAVTLLVNQTLSAGRAAGDAAPPDERKRLRARIVTVAPRGKGARGSVVTVRDEARRIVARRRVGGNIATGCAGPARVAVALREPNVYRIEVRFADGHVATATLPVIPTSPRHRTIDIPR